MDPAEKVDTTLYRFFPHKAFRAHQKEGLEKIRTSAIKGTPLLFNSPTGTGKTAMVLGGILEARAPGEKLAVITRTHSQYRIFIEEFLRVKKNHPQILMGLLVGRANLCPMGIGHLACSLLRKNSNIEIRSGNGRWYSSSQVDLYKRAYQIREKMPICPYYMNCFQKEAPRPLFNREAMGLFQGQMDSPDTPDGFMKRCLAGHLPRCPYELLKATLQKADVMILHYQYLLDPDVREAVLSANWLGTGMEKIHLVVDEAHNLATFIQDITSTECTKKDLEESLRLLRDERLEDVRYSLKDDESGKPKIESLLVEMNLFLDHWFTNKTRAELAGEGSEDVIYGKELLKIDPDSLALLEAAAGSIRKQFESKRSRQEIPEETPLPGICDVASTLRQMSEQASDRFIRTISIRPLNKMLTSRLDGSISMDDYEIALKVIDIDPRDAVKYLAENARSMTLISGTLGPTSLYRKLLFYGEKEVSEMSVPFPFPKENRLLLACRDASSQRKLRESERNVSAIKETIKALFSVKGNVAVFFTGYDMKRQYNAFCLDLCKETGKTPMDETREINKSRFIDEYKKHGNAALLAVFKGSFSEGIDYIGEAMNSVAVIGLPLAPWNEKQQMVNRYYERAFGQGVGKTIAYDLPAVTAAVQAAGRCIRSPQDTGVIILADSRYCDQGMMGVKKILPEWMQEEMLIKNAQELSDIIAEKSSGWKKQMVFEPGPQEDEEETGEKASDSEWDPGEIDESDKGLYDALRKWRTDAARNKKALPYLIMNNRTLRALVNRKPADMEALSGIRGLGPQKSAEYGKDIIEIIGKHCPAAGGSREDTTTPEAIISAIEETHQRYGAGKIAEILSGSKNRFIEEHDYSGLKSYGKLSYMKKESIEEAIDELVKNRVVYKTFGLYPALKIRNPVQKRL